MLDIVERRSNRGNARGRDRDHVCLRAHEHAHDRADSARAGGYVRDRGNVRARDPRHAPHGRAGRVRGHGNDRDRVRGRASARFRARVCVRPPFSISGFFDFILLFFSAGEILQRFRRLPDQN
jgi:hypothetical protein